MLESKTLKVLEARALTKGGHGRLSEKKTGGVAEITDAIVSPSALMKRGAAKLCVSRTA